MNAQIWFYKGSGKLFDKLIRWWTESPYSHCEVIVDGIAYGADAWNNTVRAIPVIGNFNLENWDVVDVKPVQPIAWLRLQVGLKYDYLGILGFLFFKVQDKNKWYCSELCAAYLGIDKRPISPQELWKLVKENR